MQNQTREQVAVAISSVAPGMGIRRYLRRRRPRLSGDNVVGESAETTQTPPAPRATSSSARYASEIGHREFPGAIALARCGICF